MTDAKRREVAAREARLGQALRDNLRRRKEQARAREQPAAEPPDGDRPGNPGSGGEPSA